MRNKSASIETLDTRFGMRFRACNELGGRRPARGDGLPRASRAPRLIPPEVQMGLDAAVREFLATKPDSGRPEQPVVERRMLIRIGSDELFNAFGQPVGAVYAEEEFKVARPDGEIRVRVYRP